jgi:hypothetical protein
MPKRSDVLLALWKRSQWLDDLISKMEDPKAEAVENAREMVYMAQVFAQLCKTVLYGLKDETLELRIIELEAKLKNGILIPTNREGKT